MVAKYELQEINLLGKITLMQYAKLIIIQNYALLNIVKPEMVTKVV